MSPILQGRAGIGFAASLILTLIVIGRLDAQPRLVGRPVPPADAVERGQKQFVATCGFCHGANAKGGEGGPDLVRSVLVLDDENGDKIGPVILKGRVDKGMPAFSLAAAEISDIAAFLRTRTQAAANRFDYKTLDLVTGDAKAGQAFFSGAGKCSTCHSPTGDLAGVGKKYEPEALQSKFLYPGRGQGRKSRQVTVTPASGPPVSGTLEFIDDFTVGLRDAEGFYHSWPRQTAKLEIRDPYAAHAELLRRYTDADMHNLLAYLVTLK
jgi:mono/diheme cytochrome c family protein